MGQLGAAVIGLGVGKAHISAYREAGAEVRAICDVDEGLLHDVGEASGVADLITDYRNLAERADIDVVSICTPDHIHAGPAVEMMESGKHVLVEKPLATTLPDIQAIVDTARRTGRKVSHGCQIRYGQAFQEVKRQVEAGAFGDVFYAEADYVSNHINLFQGGWRGELGRDYNALAGGSVHPVDVVQWIVDSSPEVVMAYGNGIAPAAHGLDVTDCIVAIIRFQSGCVAKTFVTMGSARPGFRNVQIYGTRKTFITSPSGGGDLVSDIEARKWGPLELGGDARDGRVALIADLLEAIETDGQPQVDVVQAARAAAICVAAFDSLRTGKPVRVPAF